MPDTKTASPVVWFHLNEISRVDNCIETENKLVIAPGGEMDKVAWTVARSRSSMPLSRSLVPKQCHSTGHTVRTDSHTHGVLT